MNVDKITGQSFSFHKTIAFIIACVVPNRLLVLNELETSAAVYNYHRVLRQFGWD